MAVVRVLAIMGSGETAPTMTSVHAELLARVGGAAARPVMLDTPYGFQENAEEIAARTVAYFHDSVGTDIEVATWRDAETASQLQYEQMCARVAQSAYVFAGPGSPSYALRQWRGTRVPELLATKLRDGGIVVFASAAAVGLGEVALPVYEIYKVGEQPRWLPGLDLVRETGLRAAVIPHYNNAEGGTHDTRFCYMGERRLRVLEAMLPDGCDILGVDEHTACIIDLEARTMTVRGRGWVTWRRRGAERTWQNGATVSFEEMARGVEGTDAQVTTAEAGSPAAAAPVSTPGDAASPFLEEVTARRREAADALQRRDVDGALGAVLALETSLHEWSSDIAGTDEPDRARAMLRELLVNLADLARQGAADPRERVAPFVDAMLGLRDSARADKRFADADALRAALVGAGVEVHDSPSGSTWELQGRPED